MSVMESVGKRRKGGKRCLREDSRFNWGLDGDPASPIRPCGYTSVSTNVNPNREALSLWEGILGLTLVEATSPISGSPPLILPVSMSELRPSKDRRVVRKCKSNTIAQTERISQACQSSLEQPASIPSAPNLYTKTLAGGGAININVKPSQDCALTSVSPGDGSNPPAKPSWLSNVAIDAIICYNLEVEEEPQNEVEGYYLGSTFNDSIVKQIRPSVLLSARNAMLHHGRLLIVYNTGNHWVLLEFLSSNDVNSVNLYDPMFSTRLSIELLVMIARILGKETELLKFLTSCRIIQPSFGGKMEEISGSVSVRRSLPQLAAICNLHIHNVGVQLEEREGFNCGLYCALWARHLMRSMQICAYDQEEMYELRMKWHLRLQQVGGS
mmetsp:Transcript_44560/g.112268  ORF Transcript_44560/g.112268 Transcript_44560/m.112268 type:complete len:383 (+) Transcript_44560:135-1283(+)